MFGDEAWQMVFPTMAIEWQLVVAADALLKIM